MTGLERNLPAAQKTTVLEVTGTIASGATYSVIASGVNYTKSGAKGDLKDNAALFSNNRMQIYLNGVLMLKTVDVVWVSHSTFILNQDVDNTDKIWLLD